MRYPLIEPQAIVAQCTCYSEVRNCSGVIKHFRHLPPRNGTPCPAHGVATL